MADALRAIMLDPDATPREAWNAIRALDELGFGKGVEVVDSLRRIVTDGYLDPSHRVSAVIALARLVPEHLGESTAWVLAAGPELQPLRWKRALLDLVPLGADLVTPLRAMLARSTHSAIREAAASVLVDLTGDGVDELRGQAADEYLSNGSRNRVMARLAELDNASRVKVVAHHLAVFRDECATIDARCAAAHQLAKLDQSWLRTVASALRHLAVNPELTPAERAACIERLDMLILTTLDDAVHLAVIAVRDPATESSARRGLFKLLPHSVRAEVERGLLADRVIPLERRLPRAGTWGELPLTAEMETEIRDALTAVESSRCEKVAAAAALSRLSARHVPEALANLERLSSEPGVAVSARRNIAKLGAGHRSRICEEAHSIVVDVTKPMRERLRYAALLMELRSNLGPQLVDLWREVASDEQQVVLWRVRALMALSQVDGLNALRAIRGDDCAPPLARWRIANHLAGATSEDRAACARVLMAIATDTRVRAGMRWRVAEDLSKFGTRGHEQALPVLWGIATDDANPVTARAHAASVLGKIAPARRRDARKILRTLSTVGKPLLRKQVLRAMGAIESSWAVQELRAMALNQDLDAVVRLSCSNAMVELRRDFREDAATVARTIAYDESVGRHVRVGAARTLARCSALCREEARDLLGSLTREQATRLDDAASDIAGPPAVST